MELGEAVSRYGEFVARRMGGTAISGEPEDQLRAPLEGLVEDVAVLAGRDPSSLSIAGETSLAELRTRPDFAVSYQGTLVGFIEVKAPGKGADPRKFRDAHDKAQRKKLQVLPNLLYTDGQDFTLWRDGELLWTVRLEGDITSAVLSATASTRARPMP